ncbi:uncharacterized protein TNCV_4079401 [Trichonephila clavipes]|nr:uncharacterized protein TNCV_4079401 [Trichonephila clavipes]
MMDRISICEALAKRSEIDPFLKRMVTGDENGVTYDNTVRKRSWSNGGQTRTNGQEGSIVYLMGLRKILKLSKQIPFINKEAELSNRIVLSTPPVNLEGGKNEICCTFGGACKIEHGYNCKSDVCKSDESTPSIQSKRGTKRRKRFTSSLRYKQVRKAVLKCTQSHPEVHRDAVRKYTQSHPEINRDAVWKYIQCHLEVNRVAVRKYTQKHPDVNRKAVKNYVSKNSHVARTKNNKYKEKISEIRLLPWTSKHLSAFKYKPNIVYSMDEIVNLGPRLPCSWCHALKWKDETQGMCCSGGKVQLPTLEPYPEPLHSLLTHQDPLSEHFLSTIRKYNGCFQMTSFGAKEIKEGNFMPTFKVQGQVYHRKGSLMARANQKPSFLQIYFMGDDHREKDIRCGIYPEIKPELMSTSKVTA